MRAELQTQLATCTPLQEALAALAATQPTKLHARSSPTTARTTLGLLASSGGALATPALHTGAGGRHSRGGHRHPTLAVRRRGDPMLPEVTHGPHVVSSECPRAPGDGRRKDRRAGARLCSLGARRIGIEARAGPTEAGSLRTVRTPALTVHRAVAVATRPEARNAAMLMAFCQGFAARRMGWCVLWRLSSSGTRWSKAQAPALCAWPFAPIAAV
jgi:hypothetical protein